MSENILSKLEDILKEISFYEKKGFDASSFKIFVKNFKEYLIVTGQTDLISVSTKKTTTKKKSNKNSTLKNFSSDEEMTFDDKLKIIQNFLEDTKAFPTIKEVIEFANIQLNLEFKDQKESREVTISRIITRIRTKPELKETLKTAVLSIRNEKIQNVRARTKKDLISAETFSKWAEIIKNI